VVVGEEEEEEGEEKEEEEEEEEEEAGKAGSGRRGTGASDAEGSGEKWSRIPACAFFALLKTSISHVRHDQRSRVPSQCPWGLKPPHRTQQ